jgi:N-carbamoyl-L-amino-acid hydrolase
VDIGVVSGIVGIASFRLVFYGRANHAGTTPMSDRRDAGLGAAAFTLAARQLVIDRFPGCVVNVGALRLEPGAFNIVPGRAELALECRAADPAELDRLQAALLEQAHREADAFNLGHEVTALGLHAPAPMSQVAQLAIQQAASALGLSTQTLTSGAGHDAQNLARLCPAGMTFVPSVEGVSHAPREFTAWEDCLNGANVLLGAALCMVELLQGARDGGID